MSFSEVIQQQLKHDFPYSWFLRDQASNSPIFHKKHLAELDERMKAYLDCFLISKRSGTSLLPILEMTDWGSVFVTALTSICTNDEESFDIALNALETEEQAKELGDALCWESIDSVKPYLDKVITHDNPLVLIGENKLSDYDEKVWEFLSHEDEEISFRAAFAGNLIGVQGAYEALQKFCFNENPYLREALSLLYQVMPENEIDATLSRIHKSNLSIRIKAYSIAMAGLPDRIPILLEWMKDPEFAPLAGEAFSFITGADIEEDDLSVLDVEVCESQEAPLAEKRKADPWTEAYEDDLPWPDPDLTANWWQKNKHNFKNGTRYLAGKTLDNDNLEITVNMGTQPQRHIASLIYTVKNPEAVFKSVKGKSTA